MLSRRHLLATTAAAAAVAALPVRAFAAAADSAAQLNALMDTFFQENLQAGPEQATSLGIDTGTNAGLRSKLSDQSSAGIAARRALSADQLRRLRAFDASGLSGMDRVNYDTISTRWNRASASTSSISAAPVSALRPMSSASRPAPISRCRIFSKPAIRSKRRRMPPRILRGLKPLPGRSPATPSA
jgi:hypothetical protein